MIKEHQNQEQAFQSAVSYYNRYLRGLTECQNADKKIYELELEIKKLKQEKETKEEYTNELYQQCLKKTTEAGFDPEDYDDWYEIRYEAGERPTWTRGPEPIGDM